MTPLVPLLVLLAALPPELHALTDELGAEITRPDAMTLYARAFVAYALVDEGLDHPEMRPAASAALDALIDRVSAPAQMRAFGEERVDVAGKPIARSVAVRGHLALALVGRARIGALAPVHAKFLTALLDGLAADVLAAPTHLVPTYGERTWPADNEVLAAALEIAHAQSLGGPHIDAARRALQNALATLNHHGLPPSRVQPHTLVADDVPRGCALSWTVAMRGLYSPARAQALWRLYRAGYWTGVSPLVGLREWPRGIDRPADADSGAIILGIGTAASGIAIGAARLAGADDDAQDLLRAGRWAGLSRLESLRGTAQLERAFIAWATSARPWLDSQRLGATDGQ